MLVRPKLRRAASGTMAFTVLAAKWRAAQIS